METVFSKIWKMKIESKDRGYLLTDYNKKNMYIVKDEREKELLFIRETAKNIYRFLLGSFAPALIMINDERQNTLFTIKRKMRFYYYEMDVFDMEGEFVGRIKRERNIFSKNFKIFNEKGKSILKTNRSILNPFTYSIETENIKGMKIIKNLKNIFKKEKEYELFLLKDMPFKEKILIIAAGIMLDYAEKKE